MTLRNRVDEALKAVDLQPSDMAAVELARLYADEIDRIDARAGTPEEGSAGLKEYGPKFLSALDALGLTPKARQARSKASKGGASDAPAPADPADEIRKRREQRRAGA